MSHRLVLPILLLPETGHDTPPTYARPATAAIIDADDRPVAPACQARSWSVIR
jgi:hypothetical protein